MNPTRRYLMYTGASLALAGSLTACAGLTPENLKLTADVALLKAEFEEARSRLNAVAFNDTERSLVDAGIAQLDEVRGRLEALTRARPEAMQILVDYSQGSSILDEIAGGYATIKEAYFFYLNRTSTEADPFLKNYAASAESAYVALDAAVESTESLDVSAVTGYLAYVLRGYALYRTGGAAAVVL